MKPRVDWEQVERDIMYITEGYPEAHGRVKRYYKFLHKSIDDAKKAF